MPRPTAAAAVRLGACLLKIFFFFFFFFDFLFSSVFCAFGLPPTQRLLRFVHTQSGVLISPRSAAEAERKQQLAMKRASLKKVRRNNAQPDDEERERSNSELVAEFKLLSGLHHDVREKKVFLILFVLIFLVLYSIFYLFI